MATKTSGEIEKEFVDNLKTLYFTFVGTRSPGATICRRSAAR